METVTIAVPVDAQTARAYQKASSETRKKIELLLSLQLRDFMSGPQRSIREIMDDIGRQAEANGLTPEILEEILHDT